MNSSNSNNTTTLHDFVIKSHEYIQSGKLKQQVYRKTIIQILWQLSTTINWLHTEMTCQHSEINPNIILIKVEHSSITTELLTRNETFQQTQNPDYKNDMWSLGMVAIFCFYPDSLKSLDKSQEENMTWAINNGKLNQYLAMNNLLKAINPKILSFINALLSTNAKKRINSNDAIKHKLFKTFYKKKKGQMQKK
eukprot:113407_1